MFVCMYVFMYVCIYIMYINLFMYAGNTGQDPGTAGPSPTTTYGH